MDSANIANAHNVSQIVTTQLSLRAAALALWRRSNLSAVEIASGKNKNALAMTMAELLQEISKLEYTFST